MKLQYSSKPYLLLDKKRCLRNINRIAEKAKSGHCELRPHFKTHQSIEIGRWFRDCGITGITVSSPSMARYFINDGWDDITVAFPFYKGQTDDLKHLEKSAELRLFINNSGDLTFLNERLENRFKFYIEIDAGYGRSGVSYQDYETIENLINTSETLPKTVFHGFYIHNGATYSCNGKQAILDEIIPTINVLKTLKNKYTGSVISLGDTPSASVLDNFNEIDECTAGNFVFYDWMQVKIGSCDIDDISLFLVLPVAQHKNLSPGTILKGGAVHCSKDFILNNGTKNYGQRIIYSENEPITASPSFISSLSQEHGILEYFNEPDEDMVIIAPIHSCLTANLHGNYKLIDGSSIKKRVLS